MNNLGVAKIGLDDAEVAWEKSNKKIAVKAKAQPAKGKKLTIDDKGAVLITDKQRNKSTTNVINQVIAMNVINTNQNSV